MVPFRAWHLNYFTMRPEQHTVAVDLTREYATALESAGQCFSAWVGPRVVAAAGVITFWPGRAQVWGLMSDEIGEFGPLVHRKVKRFLDGYRVARLECIIDPRFPASALWATRLGFSREGPPMRKYGVHGQDMHMYVRIE